MSKKGFIVYNGNFFGMFDFSHTEDEANEHLLIFEQCTLVKNIKLDDGTILINGRKFDAIWWKLKESIFQFIDWGQVKPGSFEPIENLVCSQKILMEQGWWAD